MEEQNQEGRSPLVRRPLVVRGLIGAAIIVTYTLLGFFLAPWFIERTLVNTLADRLNLETRVGDLNLNPFTLSLAADDLEIIDADGSQLFAFERLFVNFQLSSLFRWAWSFDEIHLIRPRLSLQRFSDSETNFSRLGDRWADSAPPAAPREPREPREPQEPSADRAALPRFVAADLRIIEGYVAISDQVPAEQFDTSLSPIDLAVRNFSTLPEKNGEQQVTISTESGATVAWTGNLSVNPLAVTGRVTLEGTYTPLLFRYFQDQLALPISFEGGELQASLNYQVNMDQAGQLSFRIDSLEGTLTDLNVIQPDQPHLVELGLLKLSGGTFAWPELAVHLDRVQFDEVQIQPFRYPHGGYFPDQADPAAQPRMEALPPTNTVAADAARWQFSVDSVELSNWRLLHTETELAGGVLEISSLDLMLGQLSNEPGQQMPLDITARLGTGGTVTVNGQVQALPALNLEATVAGSDLALVALQPYLNTLANVKIARGHINLNGAITSNGEHPFRYRGDFQVQDLELIDRVQEESLLSWTALTVDRLDLTPTALELSVLSLDAPDVRIEIEQDRSTNIERTLIAAEPADAAPAASPSDATSDAAPAFALTIGETRITRGSANFTDLALPLPFEAKISQLAGSLSTLATTSREPVRIDLAGQVNEFGQLQVKGNLSAYEPTAASDLSVDFENVNLPQTTPYTIKFAGRKIDDGRMDLALNYKIDNGQLDGSNRLVVRQLQLGEKVEHPGAMDLPLDLAVGLLKGPDGTLDFSFPVSGSLEDPEFSYSDAVAKAFSNVIGGLVTAPFRLLGSLVGLKAEELDHIGFKPGQADLTPPQKEVMQKLTEALAQRPQLLLEAAPVSSPAADRAAIAVALVDAEIGQRLEQHPDSDALMTDQRRQVLEALYDESGLQPGRREIEATHQAVAESETPGLDVPAYLADLRKALVDAREVSDTDISLLAQRRLDAVRKVLTETAGLPAERLSALPAEAVDLNDKDLVQMSLKVTIAD